MLLRIGIFLLAASLFGCDHATKIAAQHASVAGALAGGKGVPIYDGIVELRFAANDDTAFSLLRGLGLAKDAHVLVGLAVTALLAELATWVAWRKRLSALQHAGFALVVGGALGNLVDRAARGYVVDFIHVRWWPVFNVADVGVVAGVLMLLVFRARATRESGGSGPAGGPAPPAASA